jgi:hypothetical protein
MASRTYTIDAATSEAAQGRRTIREMDGIAGGLSRPVMIALGDERVSAEYIDTTQLVVTGW